MPTICQINTTLNLGSTGRIAEDIGITVMQNGWQSYIAYGKTSGTSQSNTIHIGNEWDMKFHALATRLFDNHGFASVHATHKFINELDAINPDIIHLHNIHGYYLNAEVLFEYIKKKRMPVVWTLHDCWPLTGHCSYFDYVNCDKWKTGCCFCPNKKGYPASVFLDRSKQNYIRKKELFTSIRNITFVTPSHWLEEIVKESFFHPYPVRTIYNGVDLSVFRPVENDSIRMKYGIKPEKRILLGVASTWDRRKGLADFIELNKLISSNIQIVLVGLHAEQIHSLPESMKGIKRTENIQELAALYSTADVFVNPTWVDNFPTTNVEALACGTPVVTYCTGGSPEAVSTNTGIVVEKGNISQLHEAIQGILRKGKGEYQLLCRKRAKELFDKKARYQDYIELYNSLL